MKTLGPIYALADSNLLFRRKKDGSVLLDDVVKYTGVQRPLVAYVGASNGDRPEFYSQIFQSAIKQVEVGETHLIPAAPSTQEWAFFEKAAIIVLAGGSVEAGWQAFARNGLRELLPKRFLEGAILVGISAGAVQLGRGGWSEQNGELLSTFGLLPFYVGAHEEQEEWRSLRRVLDHKSAARGIGLPTGTGIFYQAGELKPIGRQVVEFTIADGHCLEAVLFSHDD
ncbi:MAG TPA: Type 1 glutamine amidotransferase-like domain-containing protein [Opitutaceae bacterium]|nr:Type 1 glutamine amidotransferase-like domain-containing protein [Opitutaceae bacterium]